MNKMGKLLCCLFLAISVIFVVDSHAKTTAPQDLGEQLKVRAQEYWDYRVKNDLEKAYQYEAPETVKGLNVTEYIQTMGRGVQWLGAEVEDFKILDEGKANVLMKIRYVWTFTQNIPTGNMESKLLERWLLIDGKWYHAFRNPKGFEQKNPPTPPRQEKPESKS